MAAQHTGPLSQRIGFIGAGQMAKALARGWISAGLTGADRLAAFDVSAAAVEAFQAACGEQRPRAAASSQLLVRESDVVVLAVKPQHMPQAMLEAAREISPEKLIVSIAAGVTIESLARGLGTGRVIRVMPNTPCLAGAGASAFSPGPGASSEDCRLAQALFQAVGQAWQVEERLLDAVTGLSGSGPAFVFAIIEALSDGGVKAGLPWAIASALATQTVLGAAALIQATKEHPAVLKDQVASPGGTTIAGLRVLEERAVRGALIAAVEAAADRSRELGRGS